MTASSWIESRAVGATLVDGSAAQLDVGVRCVYPPGGDALL